MSKLDPAQQLANAFQLHQRGRLVEAERLYQAVVKANQKSFDALHMLGLVRLQLKRPGDALTLLDKAIALDSHFGPAHYNRGLALAELRRLEEAVASYDKAIAFDPSFIDAHNSRGIALLGLRRPQDALASFKNAIALRPSFAEGYSNCGLAFIDCRLPEEALASFAKAIALKPDYAEAYCNRAAALKELNQPREALVSCERAISLKPDLAEAHNNRGLALLDLQRLPEALASFDRAIACRADYGHAHYNKGLALMEANRPAEALASYDKAMALDPQHLYAFGGTANAALHCCDWTRMEQIARMLEQRICDSSSIMSPFHLLGYPSTPQMQLNCARKHVQHHVPVEPAPLWQGTRYEHERIRVAYLSADFHDHATAHLTAGLFELHDRARFEIIGVSYGRDDESPLRERLKTAFHSFCDVRGLSNLETAKLLREREVDIAVDLKGFTQDTRIAILAHRPAPIQVSYLGYPGTVGANFIDYVIADPVVLPLEEQAFFSERIIHVPGSYQVNDRNRIIGSATPTRAAAGLPDKGFVFCCFNNAYKITPPIFDIWMRLLHAVEHSVLWLLKANDAAEQRLRAEAAARGVDPQRLVFANRVPNAEHLARHRLADVFLDTLPYNAHTTASDALWTGLPVVTCKGTTFAGRVGASLLEAVGLPECIAASLDDYEALAKRLATDPSALARIRHKLAEQHLSCTLFDTDRFRRNIEAAFLNAWERNERGQKPESFAVQET